MRSSFGASGWINSNNIDSASIDELYETENGKYFLWLSGPKLNTCPIVTRLSLEGTPRTQVRADYTFSTIKLIIAIIVRCYERFIRATRDVITIACAFASCSRTNIMS